MALLVVGVVVGSLLYLVTRSLAAGLWLSAVEFPREGYRAGVRGWLTGLVGVPLVSYLIALGAIPRQTSTALRTDRSGARPRIAWRVAILATGVGAILTVAYRAHQGNLIRIDSWLFPLGAATMSAVFVLALLQPLSEPYDNEPSLRGDHVAATTGPQVLDVYLDRGADECLHVHVGTCWSLQVGRVIPQCRDGQVAWLGKPRPAQLARGLVNSQGGVTSWSIESPSPVWAATARPESLMDDNTGLFIPVTYPGLAEWLEEQPVQLAVEGPGGIGVEQELRAGLSVGLPEAQVLATHAFSNYVQARSINMVLDAVTLTVVLIGVLAFLLARIDQVLGRRGSITGLGSLTGSTYAQLAGMTATPQWGQLGKIVLIASGSAVVGALTLLILAVPAIRPSAIRRP